MSVTQVVLQECVFIVSLARWRAAAAAGGGGDVGVRESRARHERSAESCSVRRIQQDRRHRTVRSLHFLFTESDQRCCAGSPLILLESKHLTFPFNRLPNTNLPLTDLIPLYGMSHIQWGHLDYYKYQIFFQSKRARQLFLFSLRKQHHGPTSLFYQFKWKPVMID